MYVCVYVQYIHVSENIQKVTSKKHQMNVPGKKRSMKDAQTC